MKISGKFQVTDTYKHKDNKGIIVGDLLEGTIAIGNCINFLTKAGDKPLRILEIENGKTISGTSFTGLLIELNDEFDFHSLKLLKDSEIYIISAEQS